MQTEVIFKSNLNNVKKSIDKQIKSNVTNAVTYLQSEIKRKISKTSGSGRVYYRLTKRDEFNKKVYKPIHISSKEGYPPVMFTGKLYRSIKVSVESNPHTIIGNIYSTDKKAIYLEKGTYKMSKRPFFKSTFEENKEKILKILNRNSDSVTIEILYNRR